MLGNVRENSGKIRRHEGPVERGGNETGHRCHQVMIVNAGSERHQDVRFEREIRT
jgi:hypothetical protein